MVFVFDEFQFDLGKLELKRSGRPLKAESLVLKLLSVLLRHAGSLVTKEQLIEEVWDGRFVVDNAITVSMARLRKLLGPARTQPKFIVNVYGRGYRFARPVRRLEVAPDADARTNPNYRPFVGRRSVLASLREAQREASASRGGLCVLIGEPGIGKSRVVEVIDREATSARLTVAWGHCREAGGAPPLWPFAQLVRDLIEKLEQAAPAQDARAAVLELNDVLLHLQRQADPIPVIHDASGLGNVHAIVHRLFDAIARAMRLAARHAPCVLVLDDLHRADTTSLQLVHYWIEELAHAPILLIATMRKLVDRRAPNSALLIRILGHRNCTRLELSPLSEAEVTDYVGAQLDDPDGALGRAVYEKSEGNPFYMVEFVHQCRVGSTVENLTVSEAGLELMRQRVCSLDDAARGALSCAAVIGRDFEIGLLQVATGLEASALMAMLDEAQVNDVVALKSRTTFAFTHDLLRAALYDALPAAERRRHHLRIGMALEQRLLAGGTVPAADLAHHFDAAVPDGDLRRAVEYASQAATAAASACAFPDAIGHLSRARASLELMEKPSPRLRAALALREAIYARVCSAAHFAQSIEEVIRIARAARSGAIMAGAGFLLDLHPGFPPLRGADEVFAEALQYLAPDDTATRPAVLARRATSAPLAFHAARANEQVETALSLARESHSLPARFAVQLSRLYLQGGPAHEDAATQLIAEIDGACAKQPHTLSVVPVLIELHRSIVALQAGNVASSSAALVRLDAQSRSLGSRELVWHAERFRVLSRINAGEPAQQIGPLRDLHRRAVREQILGTELFCAYDRSVVLEHERFRGELPSVLRPDPADPPSVWSLKVRALAHAGFYDEAKRALNLRPAAILTDLPCDRDYLGTLGALVRAAVALDARDYLEAIHPLLEPYAKLFAAHVSFLCEGSVAELLGVSARALGRRSDALTYFGLAVAASKRAGLPVCAARARRELDACKRIS